jgi:hypothetical protein
MELTDDGRTSAKRICLLNDEDATPTAVGIDTGTVIEPPGFIIVICLTAELHIDELELDVMANDSAIPVVLVTAGLGNNRA